MNVNVQVWPTQEGNFWRSSVLLLSLPYCFPSSLLYCCCCFRSKILCGPGRKREDASEVPTPVSCLPPLQVGQKSKLGQFFFLPPRSSQSQPANLNEEEQKGRWGWVGSAILGLTGFWDLCLPRLKSIGCAFSLPEFGRIYRDKITLTLNSPM